MDDATIKRGAQLHSSWARKAPFVARAGDGEHELDSNSCVGNTKDQWIAGRRGMAGLGTREARL